MATTTTVGTTLTTIATAKAGFGEALGFQIENSDGAALNAFQLQARCSVDTDNWVVIPVSTDAASPWPAWSSTTLTSLGTDTNALLAVAGKHWVEVRLQASVASGTTSVTVYGTAG